MTDHHIALPQSHDMHSFVDTFHCPPSQQEQQQPPPPPPRKKAKRRRKRHVPPGPAGVWFQSQLHNTSNATDIQPQTHSSNNKQQEAAAADVSSCPAWMCMQHSLGLCTPYLPPYLSVQQRYHALRPLLDPRYLLLPELKGSFLLNTLQGRKLLVLVHAAAIQYHSYWTVELRDECGASLRAWMDPEMDEKECTALVQMGVVWLLRDLKILVTPKAEDWLLISKGSMERAWTPQQASKEFSDTQYIEWMTKRSQLSTTRMPIHGQDKEHDQEEHGAVEQQQETSEYEASRLRPEQAEDEEEQADGAILQRDFVSHVVTPHPLTANRNQQALPGAAPIYQANKEGTNIGFNMFQQQVLDTPQVVMRGTTSSGGRRVSMEEATTGRLGRNDKRGNGNSGQAATTPSFSQFQSSANATTTSNKTLSSVSNPYATMARMQQGVETNAMANSPSASSAALTQATSHSPIPTPSSILHDATAASQSQVSSISVPRGDKSPTATRPTQPPSRDFSEFKLSSSTSPSLQSSSTQRNVAQNSQEKAKAPSKPKTNSTKDERAAMPPFSVSREANDNPTHNLSSAKSNVPDEQSSHSVQPPRQTTDNTLSGLILSQFAAGSAVANMPLSQQGSTTSPSEPVDKRQSSKSPKTKSKSNTPSKTPTRKNSKRCKTPMSESIPEPTSNLWLGKDPMLLKMLDEDEDVQAVFHPKPPSAMPKSTASVEQRNNATLEANQDDFMEVEQEASTMFTADAFAGVDIDAYLDDDDL